MNGEEQRYDKIQTFSKNKLKKQVKVRFLDASKYTFQVLQFQQIGTACRDHVHPLLLKTTFRCQKVVNEFNIQFAFVR